MQEALLEELRNPRVTANSQSWLASREMIIGFLAYKIPVESGHQERRRADSPRIYPSIVQRTDCGGGEPGPGNRQCDTVTTRACVPLQV